MEQARHDLLLGEIEEHKREIRRLACEIWWLDEVAACWARAGAARDRLAREVQFANAQLTRRRIDVALLASRIAHETAAMR